MAHNKCARIVIFFDCSEPARSGNRERALGACASSLRDGSVPVVAVSSCCSTEGTVPRGGLLAPARRQ